MRKRYVYDKLHDKMVEVTKDNSPSPRVEIMPDIKPYKSMATGEVINSRSRHREHLKDHGLIEVGNEVEYLIKNRRKPEPPPGLRDELMRAAYKHRIFK